MDKIKHETIFRETIEVCDRAFHTLEARIPAPTRVPRGDNFVFRYEKHTPEIVVVQKLSRISTGLKASMALFHLGLYQELGAMFRMLEEFREDVALMCDAIRNQGTSDVQQRFIEEFFQEEFDSDSPLESTQKRRPIPRRKIQAELAKISKEVLNPSDAQKMAQTLTKMLSGYVHGSSGHILDMYGGDPPRYSLSGMRGTSRQKTAELYAWCYLQLSLGAFLDAAMAFGLNDLAQSLKQFMEQRYGKTETDSLNDRVQEMRRHTSTTGGRVKSRNK